MEGKSGASSRGNSSSIAYIKVVAVKKLVVDFWSGIGPVHSVWFRHGHPKLSWHWFSVGDLIFYLEKLECLKQAYAVEYISME